MRVKVENHTNYERDPFSKAIVNVDKGSLQVYKLQRKRITEMSDTKKELDSLKEEIGEIKKLLNQLINK